MADISSNLGWPLKQEHILIVGAGGAVRGVLWALLEQEPSRIDLYNRTPERAAALVDHYDDTRLRAVTAFGHDYGLIINGTSAGLLGEGLELPDHIVGTNTRCYDMSYGAGTTPFNAWCAARQCLDAADGLGMLVEQAALAFSIWCDFSPETNSVIRHLRRTLK